MSKPRSVSAEEAALRAEARALWVAVFGEAPAIEADARLMLDIIVRHLEPKEYLRFSSAERARGLAWPQDPSKGGRPWGMS
jgi:hypothetical protein